MIDWIALKFNLILTALVMAAALYLAFRRSRPALDPQSPGRAAHHGPLRDLGLGLLTIAAFVLPVPAYWLSAHTHPNAIAGLLPWNDAMGYFTCSNQILTGVPIDIGCRMRPLYSGLLAGIFEISGRDLQIALLVQAAVVGAGAYLLLRETARQLDAAATLAVFAALFLFAGEFCAALTLTENAGLLLGVLTIAILWRSAPAVPDGTFFLAMFLFAVGQNARAGAFLVFPALLAWAYFNVGRPRRERVRLVAAGIAGIAVGFGATFALTWIYGGAGDTLHSNFSYILYGISVGGKSWIQVRTDHPEIFAAGGGELELSRRIYAAAFANIMSAPHLFLWGYFKGIIHYLSHLFVFVRFIPLRVVFIALWALGLAAAWRRRADPRLTMLLWIAAGVFFSAPVLTFNGGYRIYAVTFPAEAIVVGLGVAAIAVLIARRKLESAARLGPGLAPSRSLAVIALATVVAAFIAPVAWRFIGPSAPLEASTCPDGQEAVIVRPGRETPVLPVVEEDAERIYPLQVSADDFAHRIGRWTFDPDALRQPPGTVFVWGFPMDANHLGHPLMFLWQGGEAVPLGRPVQFCVVREIEKVGHRFSIAKSMTVLPGAAP
ncbi:MAG TPA: hypothetical protein VI732_07240 [Alphaproteobacteria bacterium]|nr:hypothetical protein [Alphaproteobacteria bacterium]